MIKLVCPECQRQNEPERIYCHDCGARLDRSALAKVAPKGEDPKETHRRLHKLFDPGRVKMRLLFFKISKLVLGPPRWPRSFRCSCLPGSFPSG